MNSLKSECKGSGKLPGRIFDAFNLTFLSFLAILALLPFLYVLIYSFQSPAEFKLYGLALPRRPSLDNYRILLTSSPIVISGFRISVIITLFGTLISTVLTSALAYGLSKRNLPGQNSFTTFVFITMIVSSGMIPYYFTVRMMGMTNTIWALLIPGSVSAFYTLIMRNFFRNIPEALEESARIDGANDLTVFFRIIIPVSTPVFATIGLFYAVGRWNEYFNAVLFISNPKLYPLQVVLHSVLNMQLEQALDPAAVMRQDLIMPSVDQIRFAVVIFTTLPIMCVYPFVQKYFVKGIMLGSVKG